MAQKVRVELVDDLDGESPADETIRFALDGKDYEIDLSEYHASALRENFEDYVRVARKVSGTPKTSSGGAQPGDRSLVKKIREWAQANGHQMSDRGRIPAKIWEAYQKA